MSIIGDIFGAVSQADSAEDAAHQQYIAAAQANELQRYMYDTTRKDFKPYRVAGRQALGDMQDLMQNPRSIRNDPGYQFGLNEGTNALENSASANGMTYSGQQAKALQTFGNNYANTKLNETYNRLAGIAGVGQQATGSVANAGQNYANQSGQNMIGSGNALAAAELAKGSAYGNMVNNWSAQAGQAGRMFLGG